MYSLVIFSTSGDLIVHDLYNDHDVLKECIWDIFFNEIELEGICKKGGAEKFTKEVNKKIDNLESNINGQLGNYRLFIVSDMKVEKKVEKNVKKKQPAKEIKLDLLLSHSFPLEKDEDGNWTSTMDATGWWVSEKLDGVRAYWDPESRTIYSRNGKPYVVPEWFTDMLPDEVLDGELWQGRQAFQKTSGIVRHKTPNDKDWKTIKFMAFDLPEMNKPFEERYKKLKKLCKQHEKACEEQGIEPFMKKVRHWECESNEQLFEDLEKFEDKGSEGLMIRKPGSYYERKRSKTLLKIKSFYDSEAEVIGYQDGTGRIATLEKRADGGCAVGAMFVKSLHEIKTSRFCMPAGIEFKVGTGFTDEQRINPPEIGSTITYRFIEMTTGKTPTPRFASFIGVRDYE